MRTTFTAAPDVNHEIRAYAAARGKSLSETVNELLRKAPYEPEFANRPKFVVKPFPIGFKPNSDPYKLLQYLDEEDVQRYRNHSGR